MCTYMLWILMQYVHQMWKPENRSRWASTYLEVPNCLGLYLLVKYHRAEGWSITLKLVLCILCSPSPYVRIRRDRVIC